ncbi:MAG: aspartate dehydrogenase [Rhodospirillales bacterium]|nr:aspartate dehydrogenase [Rhodospirillales bacterium]
MQEMTVGIAGFGTIGYVVAKALDKGIPGLRLVAVSARDMARAETRMEDFNSPAAVVSLADLANRADVVVECLPAAAFLDIAEPAIETGRIFVPLSCGMLLQYPHLAQRARETGARLIVPTGALLGLDAVHAAAKGTIHSVRMVTRKPPGGLAGAPYLQEKGISVENLHKPLKVFAGSARDGAAGFPANVNVAAALSLAGIGADRTELEIWADPGQSRNKHTITVDADSARFEMTIENIPTDENPRTGKITALSVIATLEGLVSPLKVGT